MLEEKAWKVDLARSSSSWTEVTLTGRSSTCPSPSCAVAELGRTSWMTGSSHGLSAAFSSAE